MEIRYYEYTVPGTAPITLNRQTAPRIIDEFIDKLREYFRGLPGESHPIISSYLIEYWRPTTVVIQIDFVENIILYSLIVTVGKIWDLRRSILRTECHAIAPRVYTRYANAIIIKLFNWLEGPIYELNTELFNPMLRRHPAILAFNHTRNTGRHLANNSPVYPNTNADVNTGAGAGGAGAGGAGGATEGKRKHRRKRTRRTRRC